jgi:hypothetical protein
MNNKNLNDGLTHKVIFSRGKLYLDGVQIGGEDIAPGKDIAFEFNTKIPEQMPDVIREAEYSEKPPEFLSINVHDKVMGKAVGPGQL